MLDKCLCSVIFCFHFHLFSLLDTYDVGVAFSPQRIQLMLSFSALSVSLSSFRSLYNQVGIPRAYESCTVCIYIQLFFSLHFRGFIFYVPCTPTEAEIPVLLMCENNGKLFHNRISYTYDCNHKTNVLVVFSLKRQHSKWSVVSFE